ncbi:hypothetical protein RJB92_08155 [Staphylococcus hominis]|uniref:hypothetical protein n=1 Tax=Staphylococcus hominis TaxID=1290 RepID=UPI0007D9ED8C|nr:hypothetical protein [Staphylococcus hominis]MCI2871915.1 hypothetical protein [Staphylococcus hominis]MCI2876186.1 hypothetical protein [Staphylococcus hominis]MCI2891296.1 hypothetical protein [Staphylococcus hominis]MDS3868139.1 hypothetical protein [Staphylococcus hominis]OAN98857.1 hypothetical protein A3836_10795 [Staphylococcus hominis]
MHKQSKLKRSLSFNYFLLLIGVLAFGAFYFLLDANFLISYIIAIGPIIIGFTNINKIKSNN